MVSTVTSGLLKLPSLRVYWRGQAEQSFRTEKDTFGELKVPSDRYWGAQTQRYASMCIPDVHGKLSGTMML